MLDNLKLVMGGLDHTSRGTNGPNATSFIRERVEQAAQQFLPALDRIYKAQAAGDYISIADELEYELPDHLTTWKSLVGELQAAQPPMSQPVNA
jgi:hypothetical protein